MFRLLLAAVICLAPCAVSAKGEADCTSLAGSEIRWIVPSSPGGGYDAYSRLLQPFLAERLDARIFIENRPEAGGIVAALRLRDTPADGTTIGLINASGLLAAGLNPDSQAPDITKDLTILARVVHNRMALMTGIGSGIGDIHDLLEIGRQRPVVVGVRDSGSASFIAIPVTMDLLALDFQVVTGYVGSTARTLAALRGEVDVIIQNLDSVNRFVESGELRPLLAVFDPDLPGNENGLAEGMPALGGREGLASERSARSKRSPEQAREQAAGLARVIQAGRLVAAPAGLPEPVRICLETTLLDVMGDPGFREAARAEGLAVEPAAGAESLADLEAARSALPEFASLVRATLDQLRR